MTIEGSKVIITLTDSTASTVYLIIIKNKKGASYKRILFSCCCLNIQHAKKVVSDSLPQVDFAIELVNSVLNLPERQVTFFEEYNLQKNCKINSAHQNVFWAS